MTNPSNQPTRVTRKLTDFRIMTQHLDQVNDNQKKILDFVNNPDNLKKAVEGSMQKRQDLIDRVTNTELDKQLDTILETLAADAFIYGNYAFNKSVGKEPSNEELPPVESAKQKLLDLIASEKVKELEQLMPPEQYKDYAIMAGREDYAICGFDSEKFRKYLSDRIKALKENRK